VRNSPTLSYSGLRKRGGGGREGGNDGRWLTVTMAGRYSGDYYGRKKSTEAEEKEPSNTLSGPRNPSLNTALTQPNEFI